MMKTQKVIKYCAIAFALFLTFSIISTILWGIAGLSFITSNRNDKDYIMDSLENLNIVRDASELEIDVKSVNVVIKEGTSLKAETNNKYVHVKQNNNKLRIVEEKHNYFNKSDMGDLIVYIPKDYQFNDVSIENGAGKIDIEAINAQSFDLDLGAGKVSINNLLVTREIDIDSGAGELTINNGDINNLDLDMGAGKVTLLARITGNSKIDAGVGEINLNLIGESSDYRIIVNKGIGKATLNGEEVKNETYYGDGSNRIDIDGGIGSIKINYVR